MRRTVKHALAAAGISVLTAGAAVGSLTGPGQLDTAAVAAPFLVASAPADSASHTTTPLTMAEAEVRQAVLVKQHQAQAKQQATLQEHRAEAAKNRAERSHRRAAAAKNRAELAQRRAASAPEATSQPHEVSSGSPRSIARQIMRSRYGWGASQFSCYNSIIMGESKWRVHANNPSSSAYGIPQALPGSKMASAGPDWRNNPATQITWGLGYVKSRYGTPCRAWGFKRSHGWY